MLKMLFVPLTVGRLDMTGAGYLLNGLRYKSTICLILVVLSTSVFPFHILTFTFHNHYKSLNYYWFQCDGL